MQDGPARRTCGILCFFYVRLGLKSGFALGVGRPRVISAIRKHWPFIGSGDLVANAPAFPMGARSPDSASAPRYSGMIAARSRNSPLVRTFRTAPLVCAYPGSMGKQGPLDQDERHGGLS